jgi:signal transduction histidine kinase
VKRLGLRGRLVATTVLVALGAVTVLVVGLQVLLEQRAASESLDELKGRADAAAATVRFDRHGIRVLETPSDSLDQGIWVFDANGREIDGGSPPRALRGEVDRLGSSHVRRSLDVDGRYRLLARPVVRPGEDSPRAVVVAALRLTAYESAERRTLWASLLLGLVTVVGAGAAAWAASGSALAQVRRMARRADGWREHDLSGRFDLGQPRDELGELADTLDRMLDRIAQAILAERRLTDEVAHELRTPLSVIRTEAELATMQGGGDVDRSLASIVEATDRMNESIDTMMAIARAAQSDEDHCDVADLLTQARSHLPEVSPVSVQVADADRGLAVAAPLRVVAAALTPLLDNAFRHATSRVGVRVESDDRRVRLHVEDDGPGVPDELRERVFEPGHSTVEDGAGLGLSLSRRLAHSVGGSVQLGAGDTGHFVLDLPRV